MPSAPNSHRFEITGMDCASCARSVERGVGSLDGVEDCSVSYPAGILEVHGAFDSDEVMERVGALGFEGRPRGGSAVGASGPGRDSEATEEGPDAPFSLLHWFIGRRANWPALIGGVLLIPGFAFHEIMQWEALWIDLPALLALVLAGVPVVRSGWRGVRINRELNIQALMTIAAVGAVVIGAWVEAAMVMVLFSLGESLEGYAADRARRAIRGLMTVVPDRATLLEPDGTTRQVAVDDLEPGESIVVRPGERIPMDGVVTTGYTTVDESALTGESLPQDKAPGEEILAGSINGEGALELRVTRPASETTLHRMIRLIEEAQSRRAPTQRFIDRFARIYTPAVIGLAAVVAVGPPLLFGAPFLNPDPDTFGWFYRALALLVVACPCALVISVPVSVVSALTNAARSGVLIKGGAHMEMLSRIRAVAFDKTGTLTEGALTVVGVRSVDCLQTGAHVEAGRGLSAATGVHGAHAGVHGAHTGNAPPHGDVPCEPCDELLAVAAAVEERSEHPVGRAVVNAARDRLPADRIPRATAHRALTGRGITARLDDRVVTIGSPRHFGDDDSGGEAAGSPDHSGIGTPEHRPDRSAGSPADRPDSRSGDHAATDPPDDQAGRTPVLVEMDGRRLGTITLSDIPRESAGRAVEQLRRMGVETILLSGDSEGAARAVADRVGIRRVEGRLLPQDKLARIDELRHELGPIAMVGDGINDAPALAAADVGIAVGGDLGGTDQAREAAAVTLMRPDLGALPRTLRLARETMRTVRANVAFAIGVKVAFVFLVLAGMGTLWMAVLADVGATLLVTLYGLRLLRWNDRGGGADSTTPLPRPASA